MTQEITIIDEALLAEIDQLYPKDTSGYTRIQLPRISFISQDKTEGKGKTMKVVTESGTFVIERQTDKVDEEGKKIWDKQEIGSAMEGIILYRRYQLSYYDESKEEYTSSPIYDDKEEIIPLFCNKKEIARGTPQQLREKYKYVDQDGKTKSKLKDIRILYILKDGELFQLNLHGSSMYSFLKYERTVKPPAFLTEFSSEPQEKGSTHWNMMTFKPVRQLDNEELKNVLNTIGQIKEAIGLEKGATSNSPITTEDDEEIDMDKKFNEA